MFRRFRSKIRVYGNRYHGCSFKATINFLIWKDVELVGLRNCYLGFWKFSKFPKSFKKFNIFFLFPKFSPSKSKFSKKTFKMLEVNGQWICVQNFKSISPKMAEIWHKPCQKQALFTSFRDSTVIFRILFFDRFWCFKKCFRVIFRVFFFRKSDLKTCIAALNRDFFCLTFFTWWPDMTLTSIMVAKHSKWYLQMSETISMPISWLCLCLTSQFCSPMSPTPKCRTFWIWLDLWRHSWPRGQ